MIQLQVVLAILESIVELCIVSFKVPPSEFESNAPSSWISRETKTTGRLWSTCDRAGRWARLIRTRQRDGVPHFFFLFFFFRSRRDHVTTLVNVLRPFPLLGLPRSNYGDRRNAAASRGWLPSEPIIDARPSFSTFPNRIRSDLTDPLRVWVTFPDFTAFAVLFYGFHWFHPIGSNSIGFQRVNIEFVQLLKFE